MVANSNPFKVGDLVRAKSIDGPKMLVTDCTGDTVSVCWFTSNHDYVVEFAFAAKLLEKCRVTSR